MKYTVPALKALIMKNNKMLVLRKESSSWTDRLDLPDGKMAYGEEPNECLKREVEEETEIEFDIMYPLSMGTIAFNNEVQVVGILVLCSYKSGEVVLSKEHNFYEWTELERARQLEFPSWVRSGIERLSADYYGQNRGH